MSDTVVERARRNSVNKERKKVVRRKRKVINYVTLILLIVSILGNMALLKKVDLSNPNNFSDITYGQDYDKEFEDVNALVEACIKKCIQTQIKEDTKRAVDENGIDSGKYYYNFTNYNNIFSNLEITINEYKMNYSDSQIFNDSISNLTEEEKAAILIYYGTSFVNGDKAKEEFKRHVGDILIDNNISEKAIEALAERAVRELSGNLLDNHWIDNNLGKGL